MQNHQIVCRDSENGISPAVVTAKFNLVSEFSKRFHDSSNLSLNELCLRYIPKQCNDIQLFD